MSDILRVKLQYKISTLNSNLSNLKAIKGIYISIPVSALANKTVASGTTTNLLSNYDVSSLLPSGASVISADGVYIGTNSTYPINFQNTGNKVYLTVFNPGSAFTISAAIKMHIIYSIAV